MHAAQWARTGAWRSESTRYRFETLTALAHSEPMIAQPMARAASTRNSRCKPSGGRTCSSVAIRDFRYLQNASRKRRTPHSLPRLIIGDNAHWHFERSRAEIIENVTNYLRSLPDMQKISPDSCSFHSHFTFRCSASDPGSMNFVVAYSSTLCPSLAVARISFATLLPAGFLLARQFRRPIHSIGWTLE